MQLNFTDIKPKIVPVSSIVVPEHMKVRHSSGIEWFDRVMGLPPTKPGMIAGSVIIVAGDPGSGKSTVLRQVCSMTGLKALYNVGEEGLEQVKLALEERKFGEDFDISNFSDVDDLLDAAKDQGHKILVIDSLQNLFSKEDHQGRPMKGAPGSNKQVQLVTEKLYAYAKQSLTIVFLICHSTKSGDFKGPQTLEHTIDVSIKLKVTETTVEASEGDEEDEIVERGEGEEGEEPEITTDKVTRIVTKRTMVAEKNRFGLTGVEYNLDLTDRGLVFIGMQQGSDEPKNEAPKSSSKGRVRSIAAAIREERPAISRKDFIAELIEKAECSPFTAQAYWSAK